ncbi:MAG: 1-deoxy-D-xylulose-5-phosphate synthase [Paludibacteraceae bacterium]|nr:1-deoxy-D-xylulose-5-phosphate synthase [Paludibacteraceae bacterium]MBR5971706.1 1-deoxy-D-xylulose-5-phosphate synthase [Paludibacteraceae bacterium]
MSDTVGALLQKVEYPSDLKKLKEEELPQFCQELRQFIIDELSHNPGHLGASLGVVELTVALHYVYDMPSDNIVWDVGHQAYGHKIITGRRTLFHTNRQLGGLCGFPNPAESEYDSFIAGHASNSISAALGLDIASAKLKENKHTVAVIGDAAISGGLAFEGLNNTSFYKNNLLIVLNDNHMAIDTPVGGLSDYLVRLTTSKTYNKWRYRFSQLMQKWGLINEKKKGLMIRRNNSLKAAITNQHNIFEGLNIRYFGPVDGHDVQQLVKILREIKEYEGPKVLHIKTTKGKGFKPAEESAAEWHAPGKFNKETGERIIPPITKDTPPLFQDVFGHTLLELARENEKIIGITPAMPSGCSMSFMMHEMPDRVYDVGISEGHAVTFSAGLAKEGMMPFCNIYSSFMQRAFDNVIHDVALQNLDMVLCLDRAGLVGADGATHHGAFDLAAFRCVPNLTIASPMNVIELRNLMYTASQPGHGPFMIRYPRGKGVLLDWHLPFQTMEVGKGYCVTEGDDVAVLSLGPLGYTVQKAISKAKELGLSVAHYNMLFLKPLDETLLHDVAKKFKKIVTVEDGVIKGGFGSAVLEFLADNGYTGHVVSRVGLPDQFATHGTPDELYHLYGMDADGVLKVIQEINSKMP